MNPLEVAARELEKIREARKRLQILKLERLANRYGELLWAALHRKYLAEVARSLETLPGENDLQRRTSNLSEE